MKNKLLCIIIIMLCINLIGCNEQNGGTLSNSEVVGMIPITNAKALMYREDTKIVYIVFNEIHNALLNSATGYGYMAPYISENGNYYKYEDGRLIELIK